MPKVLLPIIGEGTPPNIAFFNLLRDHPLQQRKLIWEPCLLAPAEERAEQISKVFAHCYKGDCPNRTVRKYCGLPLSYPENGNSLESIVGGVQDFHKALKLLLDSEKHADHLLGKNTFFRGQTKCAVAYRWEFGSAYQFYYVVLIAG